MVLSLYQTEKEIPDQKQDEATTFKASPSDVCSSAGLNKPKIVKFSKVLPPAANQVFKHMNLWGTLQIQAIT